MLEDTKTSFLGPGVVFVAGAGMIAACGMLLSREPVLACQDPMASIQVIEARLAELEKAPRMIQAENVHLEVYPVERIPYQKVSKP
jgi:hypothetical protein